MEGRGQWGWVRQCLDMSTSHPAPGTDGVFMKRVIMNIIGGKERPQSRENLSWNPKEPPGCTRWGKVVPGRAAGSARPRQAMSGDKTP